MTKKAAGKYWFILSEGGSWLILKYSKNKKTLTSDIPITEVVGKILYMNNKSGDNSNFDDYEGLSTEKSIEVELFKTDKKYKFNTLEELISNKEIFPFLLKGHYGTKK